MADIKVQKVSETTKAPTLPVFKEMAAILERIRARAFELFSQRGFADGNALDDWLTAEREICWPACELVENADSYNLCVALPGFEPADVSVTARAHDLIVHARAKTETKKQESSNAGVKLCWSEFRSNDVYRQVDFSTDIDPQSVTAKLTNGLLRISATKAPKTARVIPISSAVA